MCVSLLYLIYILHIFPLFHFLLLGIKIYGSLKKMYYGNVKKLCTVSDHPTSIKRVANRELNIINLVRSLMRLNSIK